MELGGSAWFGPVQDTYQPKQPSWPDSAFVQVAHPKPGDLGPFGKPCFLEIQSFDQFSNFSFSA